MVTATSVPQEGLDAAWKDLVTHKGVLQNWLHDWDNVDQHYKQAKEFLSSAKADLKEREDAVTTREKALAERDKTQRQELENKKAKMLIEVKQEKEKWETEKAKLESDDPALGALLKQSLTEDKTPDSSHSLRKKLFVAELRETFQSGDLAKSKAFVVEHLHDRDKGLSGSQKQGHSLGVGGLRPALSSALTSIENPGKLVLDMVSSQNCFPLPGNKPIHNGEGQVAARKAFLVMLEALNTVGGTQTEDNTVRASAMLTEWQKHLMTKAYFTPDPSDAYAFVLLTLGYELQSKTDEAVMMRVLKQLANRKHAPDHVRALGLASRVPDLVKGLLEDGKITEGVTFVKEFGLDSFDPAQMVQEHVEKKKVLADKSKACAAIKQAIRCITQHSIEGCNIEELKKTAASLQAEGTAKKRATQNSGTSSAIKRQRQDSNDKRQYGMSNQVGYNHSQRVGGNRQYDNRYDNSVGYGGQDIPSGLPEPSYMSPHQSRDYGMYDDAMQMPNYVHAQQQQQRQPHYQQAHLNDRVYPFGGNSFGM